MCNSKNLGALIVKDEPHMKSWDEPQYSIHNIGIEESYGFGVLNEGKCSANSYLKEGFSVLRPSAFRRFDLPVL